MSIDTAPCVQEQSVVGRIDCRISHVDCGADGDVQQLQCSGVTHRVTIDLRNIASDQHAHIAGGQRVGEWVAGDTGAPGSLNVVADPGCGKTRNGCGRDILYRSEVKGQRGGASGLRGCFKDGLSRLAYVIAGWRPYYSHDGIA